jgi:hypothetical protein
MSKKNMQNDTPWKLTSIPDIMVLICYILKTATTSKEKLSTDIMIKVIEQEGIADYFDITEAISNLSKNDCITITEQDDKEYLELTQLGLESSTELEKTVSGFVRKRAAKAAIRALSKLKAEHDNKVEIANYEGSWYVTCRVCEGDKVLLSQTVLCGDIYQAERIKDQFLATPDLIYRGSLALLIGDVNSIGGLATISDSLSKD